MNLHTHPRRARNDAGFTLPELLIAIVITMTIISVLAMTIMTSMKTAPSVTNRADTAVAVQGITTWLPPDVDSSQPGKFDVDPATVSGCAGPNPGTNVVRLQWSETFKTITTTYVANYRFVVNGAVGQIVRLSCNGKFALSAPQTLTMTAKLSNTVPVVSADDFDGDHKNDRVTIEIVTLAGEHVLIESVTKDPDDTLAPVVTTTTSPAVPNQPPTADPITISVNDSVPITFALSGHDPENGAMTYTVTSVPAGWLVSVSGASVTLTAYGTPGTATLKYQATDPLGAISGLTDITVNLIATTTTTAPNQPPTADPITITVNDSVPITFALSGHDPENGAMTYTVTSVPAGWSVSVIGASVTLTAYGTPGTATLQYRATDPLAASSGLTNITVNLISTPTSSTTTTTSPPTTTTTSTTTTTTTTTSTTTTTTVPPCVVASMTVSPNAVELQNKNIAKLKTDVIVTISGISGYCVGLTLQYDTGAPNNQWVRNFPTSSPYTIRLEGQPAGTELWATGTHVLYVKNGSNVVLKQANLVVTD